MPRQESEYELLGAFCRLKCGKTGQERKRGTTVLLLLRKEKVYNVEWPERKLFQALVLSLYLMSIIKCPLMGLQAAGIETERSDGECRAGRTETVD